MSSAAVTARPDDPARGIGFVVVAMLLFAVQDATIKWLSAEQSVFQLVWIRSLIAAALLPGFAALNGGLGTLRPRRLDVHLVRGLLAFLAYVSYYLALAAMPMAEAIALFFAAPLMITALSAPLLGEPVGWRRWSATAVGFLGVLVMMRPGTAAFEPAGLLALAAAGFYAGMQLLARRHAAAETGVSMALSATLVYIAVSGAIGLAFHDGLPLAGTGDGFLTRAWHWPEPVALALIAGTGITFTAGFYAIAQAYRSSPPAVVAPFEYLAVPLGAAAGYLIWRTVPEPTTLAGASIVIASGLYVLYRERVRSA
jgi:drug/metabolite transporter (DMT)-like permease